MRTAFAAAALAVAGVAPLSPAAAEPPQPWDPKPTVLDGWGFCSLYRADPGTSVCWPSYVATTPFGELELLESSADATLVVRCTHGGATLTETARTTIVHAGKCALFLTTHTSGTASARLRSVLTPQ